MKDITKEQVVKFILDNEALQTEAAEYFQVRPPYIGVLVRKCDKKTRKKIKKILGKRRSEGKKKTLTKKRMSYNQSMGIQIFEQLKNQKNITNIDIMEFELKKGYDIPVEHVIKAFEANGIKIKRI